MIPKEIKMKAIIYLHIFQSCQDITAFWKQESMWKHCWYCSFTSFSLIFASYAWIFLNSYPPTRRFKPYTNFRESSPWWLSFLKELGICLLLASANQSSGNSGNNVVLTKTVNVMQTSIQLQVVYFKKIHLRNNPQIGWFQIAYCALS